MKAKEMTPVRGTCTVRKRVEEFFKGLLSEEEALAVAMGAYEEDSEKENQDVGEGSSFSILCPMLTPRALHLSLVRATLCPTVLPGWLLVNL